MARWTVAIPVPEYNCIVSDGTEPINPDAGILGAILATLEALLQRAPLPRRFLSVKSASLYTDLSEDSIRRLIERGDLTAHRPVRGKLLIDRNELDQLILGSTNRPTTGRGIRCPGGNRAEATHFRHSRRNGR